MPDNFYPLQVVNDYKDFAFSDYARVGRALVLYEIGDRDESIAEMEDVSISLKGYPGKISYAHRVLVLQIMTCKFCLLEEFCCRGSCGTCCSIVCGQARSTSGREPVHHCNSFRPSLYRSFLCKRNKTLATELG